MSALKLSIPTEKELQERADTEGRHSDFDAVILSYPLTDEHLSFKVEQDLKGLVYIIGSRVEGREEIVIVTRIYDHAVEAFVCKAKEVMNKESVSC